MRRHLFILIMLFLVFGVATSSMVSAKEGDKKAIVIANFGTTYPEALKAITAIYHQVKKEFPETEVKLAFTSNIIRNIWQKRRKDREFLSRYPNIPNEILNIKGPLATISLLQDRGYKTIIVQPTHIYAGEEYMDLCSYVAALNSIMTIKKRYRPFKRIAIGRPLLGKWGTEHDYHEDISAVVEALKGDVMKAKKMRSALVYMGHGNEYFSTGAYIEFQKEMRKRYPKVPVFVGTVEGFPSLEDVIRGLVHMNIKKALLKPFMIVAGDHARNDMAGDDKESWKSVLESRGISVITDIKGLGEEPGIVRIIIKHIKDAAKDNDIEL